MKVGLKRYREFQEAVQKMDPIKHSDWDLPGPVTAPWCLTFLKKKGGPMVHHEMLKTLGKLKETDYGVSEHETIMRAIKDGAEIDQVDESNLLAFEHLFHSNAFETNLCSEKHK